MTKREKILRDELKKMAERYHDLSKASEHHGTDSDYYTQAGVNELADMARDALKQADEVKDNIQTIEPCRISGCVHCAAFERGLKI